LLASIVPFCILHSSNFNFQILDSILHQFYNSRFYHYSIHSSLLNITISKHLDFVPIAQSSQSNKFIFLVYKPKSYTHNPMLWTFVYHTFLYTLPSQWMIQFSMHILNIHSSHFKTMSPTQNNVINLLWMIVLSHILYQKLGILVKYILPLSIHSMKSF
jgi:hypothetical protein